MAAFDDVMHLRVNDSTGTSILCDLVAIDNDYLELVGTVDDDAEDAIAQVIRFELEPENIDNLIAGLLEIKKRCFPDTVGG